MSLRRDRPIQRKRKEWVSPPVWRALFASSPLVSLVGAAAGGVFLIRVPLVSSSSEYSFGPDIPIAGAVLLLWGVWVWALLSPPQSVVAQEADGASVTGVIWSLGRRLRLGNVVAAPVFGLILGMLGGPAIEAVTDVLNGATPGWAINPIVLTLTGAALLGAFVTARLPLWGAEVRSDRLIVRGALLTRRYRRSDIASVECRKVTGLADGVLGILFNSPSMVFFVLRMNLTTGRTKTLYASHSSKSDIDRAARIVTAWLTSRSAVAATAPAKTT